MTPRRLAPTENDGKRGRQVLTKASAGALGIGLVVGTLAAVTALNATSTTGEPAACDATEKPLVVVAAPEVAPVVTGVLQATTARQDCSKPISVISSDAAKTAADIQSETGDRPDVWIPDSSIWTERSTAPGTGLPTNNPSLASSPLTVAVPAEVATRIGKQGGRLSVTDLLPASPEAPSRVRWVLPAPERQSSTVFALLGLRAALTDRSDASAILSTVIRASSRDSTDLARLGKGSTLALPVSEQQLFTYNLSKPGSSVIGAHLPIDGVSLDYPFVTLTAERSRRDDASELLKSLQSELGQRLFGAAGFRSATGDAGAPLLGQAGLDAAQATAGKVPDGASVNRAINAYARVTRPTRLLAVLDTSGSMNHPVPGAPGATRLNLAVQAAVNGLAVYPDETSVGLWAFATDLTPTTDYRVLAPVRPLERGADGVVGREQLAKALAGVRISPRGKSGLYDTTLAAVREMRRTWDPTRENSIVVITDGGNNDPRGISQVKLLSTLAKENDPEKPVAVFAIAYGPKGDLQTLAKISDVTGGKAYAAPDPRMISRVLADAIGRRACTPDC